MADPDIPEGVVDKATEVAMNDAPDRGPLRPYADLPRGTRRGLRERFRIALETAAPSIRAQRDGELRELINEMPTIPGPSHLSSVSTRDFGGDYVNRLDLLALLSEGEADDGRA